MFLKSINLTNFRNYDSTSFEFKKPVTLLIGDNAQGKSNFLESIYYLATAKSPKAEQDEELIKYGENVLRVEGKVEPDKSDISDKSEDTDLEIVLQVEEGRLQKRARVNGISRRVFDYSTNLTVVLFSPEDVNLVTGSPSLRRDHIDQIISQVDKSYKKAISSYENIITRKNKILKRIREEEGKAEELTYWSDQQIMLGQIISIKRKEFFDFINGVEKKFGEFTFEYLENIISNERLKQYLQKEIDAASSLIGPQRDDFIFKLKDTDLSKYGSRGEQRTAVLDMKLAEVSFIESILGTRPILLLDDIFSELDISHRQHVVDLSFLQQTVIATVEFDDYLKEAFKTGSLNRVKKAQLSKFT